MQSVVVEGNLLQGRLFMLPDRSNATFYKWRSRYGGMEVSDARKRKALEDEKRRLKKLLAESMVDASTLKEMLGKNF